MRAVLGVVTSKAQCFPQARSIRHGTRPPYVGTSPEATELWSATAQSCFESHEAFSNCVSRNFAIASYAIAFPKQGSNMRLQEVVFAFEDVRQNMHRIDFAGFQPSSGTLVVCIMPFSPLPRIKFSLTLTHPLSTRHCVRTPLQYHIVRCGSMKRALLYNTL